MNELRPCLSAGYACLAAWADLIDRINVFPVADSDTGTNLRISLAPLRDPEQDRAALPGLLTRRAVGNSGNIAAAFFREFCQAEGPAALPAAACAGRDKAWAAVADPRQGTMLSVFACLAATLAGQADLASLYPRLCHDLQETVRATQQQMPELSAAGVVDAGALAMHIFFDGFFRCLSGQEGKPASVLEVFAGQLAVSRGFRPEGAGSRCVDAILRREAGQSLCREAVRRLGDSVVMAEEESLLKLHVHTADTAQLRAQLAAFGTVEQWSEEEIVERAADTEPAARPCLHVITDAAGSVSRDLARQHGISLLDSYIVAGNEARPETLCSPAEIYLRQRKGEKITTAQASAFERSQRYASLCRQFGPCLYCCAGSAFTGNYAAALAWKQENDPENLLTVLDTGAAAGSLALIALRAARCARTARSQYEVLACAQAAMAECSEYIFVDELKYLAAGGRVSKAGSFFADLLGLKPVISPMRNRVQKVGLTRSSKGQLAFALARLRERFAPSAAPVILLQHSDNAAWLTETVQPQIRALLPQAEILRTPLSLTSGVHLGPGAWAVAFAECRA
jgi:hypothetical protein